MSFNIPKIKRHSERELQKVTSSSRDAQDVLSHVERSYLDPKYKGQWHANTVHMVHNKELEETFRAKKQAMKDDGRHPRELTEQYAFLFIKDSFLPSKIARNGLLAYSSSMNCLGDPNMGVYVCKHADVQLMVSEKRGINTCFIMVFKIITGKCKSVPIVFGRSGMPMEPTPNYDCHISSVNPQINELFTQLSQKSMIYLYEYTDMAEPSRQPRHCLPYACVQFVKNEKACAVDSDAQINKGAYDARPELAKKLGLSDSKPRPKPSRFPGASELKPWTKPVKETQPENQPIKKALLPTPPSRADTLKAKDDVGKQVANYSVHKTREDPRLLRMQQKLCSAIIGLGQTDVKSKEMSPRDSVSYMPTRANEYRQSSILNSVGNPSVGVIQRSEKNDLTSPSLASTLKPGENPAEKNVTTVNLMKPNPSLIASTVSGNKEVLVQDHKSLYATNQQTVKNINSSNQCVAKISSPQSAFTDNVEDNSAEQIKSPNLAASDSISKHQTRSQDQPLLPKVNLEQANDQSSFTSKVSSQNTKNTLLSDSEPLLQDLKASLLSCNELQSDPQKVLEIFKTVLEQSTRLLQDSKQMQQESKESVSKPHVTPNSEVVKQTTLSEEKSVMHTQSVGVNDETKLELSSQDPRTCYNFTKSAAVIPKDQSSLSTNRDSNHSKEDPVDLSTMDYDYRKLNRAKTPFQDSCFHDSQDVDLRKKPATALHQDRSLVTRNSYPETHFQSRTTSDYDHSQFSNQYRRSGISLSGYGQLQNQYRMSPDRDNRLTENSKVYSQSGSSTHKSTVDFDLKASNNSQYQLPSSSIGTLSDPYDCYYDSDNKSTTAFSGNTRDKAISGNSKVVDSIATNSSGSLVSDGELSTKGKDKQADFSYGGSDLGDVDLRPKYSTNSDSITSLSEPTLVSNSVSDSMNKSSSESSISTEDSNNKHSPSTSGTKAPVDVATLMTKLDTVGLEHLLEVTNVIKGINEIKRMREETENKEESEDEKLSEESPHKAMKIEQYSTASSRDKDSQSSDKTVAKCVNSSGQHEEGEHVATPPRQVCSSLYPNEDISDNEDCDRLLIELDGSPAKTGRAYSPRRRKDKNLLGYVKRKKGSKYGSSSPRTDNNSSSSGSLNAESSRWNKDGEDSHNYELDASLDVDYRFENPSRRGGGGGSFGSMYSEYNQCEHHSSSPWRCFHVSGWGLSHWKDAETDPHFQPVVMLKKLDFRETEKIKKVGIAKSEKDQISTTKDSSMLLPSHCEKTSDFTTNSVPYKTKKRHENEDVISVKNIQDKKVMNNEKEAQTKLFHDQCNDDKISHDMKQNQHQSTTSQNSAILNVVAVQKTTISSSSQTFVSSTVCSSNSSLKNDVLNPNSSTGSNIDHRTVPGYSSTVVTSTVASSEYNSRNYGLVPSSKDANYVGISSESIGKKKSISLLEYRKRKPVSDITESACKQPKVEETVAPTEKEQVSGSRFQVFQYNHTSECKPVFDETCGIDDEQEHPITSSCVFLYRNDIMNSICPSQYGDYIYPAAFVTEQNTVVYYPPSDFYLTSVRCTESVRNSKRSKKDPFVPTFQPVPELDSDILSSLQSSSREKTPDELDDLKDHPQLIDLTQSKKKNSKDKITDDPKPPKSDKTILGFATSDTTTGSPVVVSEVTKIPISDKTVGAKDDLKMDSATCVENDNTVNLSDNKSQDSMNINVPNKELPYLSYYKDTLDTITHKKSEGSSKTSTFNYYVDMLSASGPHPNMDSSSSLRTNKITEQVLSDVEEKSDISKRVDEGAQNHETCRSHSPNKYLRDKYTPITSSAPFDNRSPDPMLLCSVDSDMELEDDQQNVRAETLDYCENYHVDMESSLAIDESEGDFLDINGTNYKASVSDTNSDRYKTADVFRAALENVAEDKNIVKKDSYPTDVYTDEIQSPSKANFQLTGWSSNSPNQTTEWSLKTPGQSTELSSKTVDQLTEWSLKSPCQVKPPNQMEYGKLPFYDLPKSFSDSIKSESIPKDNANTSPYSTVTDTECIPKDDAITSLYSSVIDTDKDKQSAVLSQNLIQTNRKSCVDILSKLATDSPVKRKKETDIDFYSDSDDDERTVLSSVDKQCSENDSRVKVRESKSVLSEGHLFLDHQHVSSDSGEDSASNIKTESQNTPSDFNSYKSKIFAILTGQKTPQIKESEPLQGYNEYTSSFLTAISQGGKESAKPVEEPHLLDIFPRGRNDSKKDITSTEQQIKSVTERTNTLTTDGKDYKTEDGWIEESNEENLSPQKTSYDTADKLECQNTQNDTQKTVNVPKVEIMPQTDSVISLPSEKPAKEQTYCTQDSEADRQTSFDVMNINKSNQMSTPSFIPRIVFKNIVSHTKPTPSFSQACKSPLFPVLDNISEAAKSNPATSLTDIAEVTPQKNLPDDIATNEDNPISQSNQLWTKNNFHPVRGEDSLKGEYSDSIERQISRQYNEKESALKEAKNSHILDWFAEKLTSQQGVPDGSEVDNNLQKNTSVDDFWNMISKKEDGLSSSFIRSDKYDDEIKEFMSSVKQQTRKLRTSRSSTSSDGSRSSSRSRSRSGSLRIDFRSKSRSPVKQIVSSSSKYTSKQPMSPTRTVRARKTSKSRSHSRNRSPSTSHWTLESGKYKERSSRSRSYSRTRATRSSSPSRRKSLSPNKTRYKRRSSRSRSRSTRSKSGSPFISFCHSRRISGSSSYAKYNRSPRSRSRSRSRSSFKSSLHSQRKSEYRRRLSQSRSLSRSRSRSYVGRRRRLRSHSRTRSRSRSNSPRKRSASIGNIRNRRSRSHSRGRHRSSSISPRRRSPSDGNVRNKRSRSHSRARHRSSAISPRRRSPSDGNVRNRRSRSHSRTRHRSMSMSRRRRCTAIGNVRYRKSRSHSRTRYRSMSVSPQRRSTSIGNIRNKRSRSHSKTRSSRTSASPRRRSTSVGDIRNGRGSGTHSRSRSRYSRRRSESVGRRRSRSHSIGRVGYRKRSRSHSVGRPGYRRRSRSHSLAGAGYRRSQSDSRSRSISSQRRIEVVRGARYRRSSRSRSRSRTRTRSRSGSPFKRSGLSRRQTASSNIEKYKGRSPSRSRTRSRSITPSSSGHRSLRKRSRERVNYRRPSRSWSRSRTRHRSRTTSRRSRKDCFRDDRRRSFHSESSSSRSHSRSSRSFSRESSDETKNISGSSQTKRKLSKSPHRMSRYQDLKSSGSRKQAGSSSCKRRSCSKSQSPPKHSKSLNNEMSSNSSHSPPRKLVESVTSPEFSHSKYKKTISAMIVRSLSHSPPPNVTESVTSQESNCSKNKKTINAKIARSPSHSPPPKLTESVISQESNRSKNKNTIIARIARSPSHSPPPNITENVTMQESYRSKNKKTMNARIASRPSHSPPPNVTKSVTSQESNYLKNKKTINAKIARSPTYSPPPKLTESVTSQESGHSKNKKTMSARISRNPSHSPPPNVTESVTSQEPNSSKNKKTISARIVRSPSHSPPPKLTESVTPQESNRSKYKKTHARSLSPKTDRTLKISSKKQLFCGQLRENSGSISPISEHDKVKAFDTSTSNDDKRHDLKSAAKMSIAEPIPDEKLTLSYSSTKQLESKSKITSSQKSLKLNTSKTLMAPPSSSNSSVPSPIIISSDEEPSPVKRTLKYRDAQVEQKQVDKSTDLPIKNLSQKLQTEDINKINKFTSYHTDKNKDFSTKPKAKQIEGNNKMTKPLVSMSNNLEKNKHKDKQIEGYNKITKQLVTTSHQADKKENPVNVKPKDMQTKGNNKIKEKVDATHNRIGKAGDSDNSQPKEMQTIVCNKDKMVTCNQIDKYNGSQDANPKDRRTGEKNTSYHAAKFVNTMQALPLVKLDNSSSKSNENQSQTSVLKILIDQKEKKDKDNCKTVSEKIQEVQTVDLKQKASQFTSKEEQKNSQVTLKEEYVDATSEQEQKGGPVTSKEQHLDAISVPKEQKDGHVNSKEQHLDAISIPKEHKNNRVNLKEHLDAISVPKEQKDGRVNIKEQHLDAISIPKEHKNNRVNLKEHLDAISIPKEQKDNRVSLKEHLDVISVPEKQKHNRVNSKEQYLDAISISKEQKDNRVNSKEHLDAISIPKEQKDGCVNSKKQYLDAISIPKEQKDNRVNSKEHLDAISIPKEQKDNRVNLKKHLDAISVPEKQKDNRVNSKEHLDAIFVPEKQKDNCVNSKEQHLDAISVTEKQKDSRVNLKEEHLEAISIPEKQKDSRVNLKEEHLDAISDLEGQKDNQVTSKEEPLDSISDLEEGEVIDDDDVVDESSVKKSCTNSNYSLFTEKDIQSVRERTLTYRKPSSSTGHYEGQSNQHSHRRESHKRSRHISSEEETSPNRDKKDKYKETHREYHLSSIKKIGKAWSSMLLDVNSYRNRNVEQVDKKLDMKNDHSCKTYQRNIQVTVHNDCLKEKKEKSKRKEKLDDVKSKDEHKMQSSHNSKNPLPLPSTSNDSVKEETISTNTTVASDVSLFPHGLSIETWLITNGIKKVDLPCIQKLFSVPIQSDVSCLSRQQRRKLIHEFRALQSSSGQDEIGDLILAQIGQENSHTERIKKVTSGTASTSSETIPAEQVLTNDSEPAKPCIQGHTILSWLLGNDVQAIELPSIQKIIPEPLESDLSALSKNRRRKILRHIRSLQSASRTTDIGDLITEQVKQATQTALEEASKKQISFELHILTTFLEKMKANPMSEVLKAKLAASSYANVFDSSVGLQGGPDLVSQLSNYVNCKEGELKSALHDVEIDLRHLLDKTDTIGHPHRKVPEEILLEEEKTKYYSITGCFLLLWLPMSRKAFDKLLAMKDELLTYNEEIKEAREAGNQVLVDAFLEKIKVVNLKRSDMITTFTGTLTIKRVKKLINLRNKYHMCLSNLKNENDVNLPIIEAGLTAINNHITVCKELLSKVAWLEYCVLHGTDVQCIAVCPYDKELAGACHCSAVLSVYSDFLHQQTYH